MKLTEKEKSKIEFIVNFYNKSLELVSGGDEEDKMSMNEQLENFEKCDDEKIFEACKKALDKAYSDIVKFLKENGFVLKNHLTGDEHHD
ncbi:hypothetical protein M3M35_07175 [Fructilactobacillus myrtifloralis]|uniref:Uncharacterized protein n=1 Tax=Fructilactobacillus myrtifloralis TaxID=2940301 RepID=A0ABY5BN14_9LACO|nr:hypothetical protein [Fructilactobacillus myrtifloralis]USS85063.1 hypothetical protein M3M35_07175 [Fructilactobacillus myrtifloralis]